MKWYEWVLVFVLVISSGVLSYFFALKSFEQRFRVVDVVGLINEEKERIMNTSLSLEEKEKKFGTFLSDLEKILADYDGIVLIKQAVVGGSAYEDITPEVRRRLEGKEGRSH